MSISKVKPGGWGGTRIETADMNALDTNASYCLDKRSGQSDTCESTVTWSDGGLTFSGSGVLTIGATGNLTMGSAADLELYGSGGAIGSVVFPKIQGGTTTFTAFLSVADSALPTGAASSDTTWRATVPSTAKPYYIQQNGSASALSWKLPVIQGATISAITAYLSGNSVASLPGTMPTVRAYKTTLSSGSSASLLSTTVATDASASTGAYNAYHTIVYTPDQNNTGLSLNGDHFHATLLGASGGGHVDGGLFVYGISVTYSHTRFAYAIG